MILLRQISHLIQYNTNCKGNLEMALWIHQSEERPYESEISHLTKQLTWPWKMLPGWA